MLQTIDPLTQLAFSVYENKGVFALLLGSGLSRAADIPTGWEITLDLIQRVARADGIEGEPDWETWYREKTGQDPEYSALVQELGLSAAERRSILDSYIEPTEEDREDGRKVPTAAHYAIADLVRGGYIRVIVTTNFDRLMENALRERGIEPTVVASPDALKGATPIAHSTGYILKLHGDYKDTRILNTEAELRDYPADYDRLLDRIFDEYGLIVCGWSGKWDDALRAAILRSPNRRYSMYWARLGELGSRAQELIAHRDGRVVPISGADNFFRGIQQRVETLQQSQRRNPLSIELLVASTKRFLAKSEHRIQLNDLFGEETDRLVARLDGPDLSPPSTWDAATFQTYVQRFEAATEALACMCGILGRWGDDGERPIIRNIVRVLWNQAEKVGGGHTQYLYIRSYPAMLAFTAYGLGLTRAGRWAALHGHFDGPIFEDGESGRAVGELFLTEWKGASQDLWNQLQEQKFYTPMNNHLFRLFSGWGRRFIDLEPDFELMFGRFEMLGALAYLETCEKDEIRQSLANKDRPGRWMPVGRVGWDKRNAKKLLGELKGLMRPKLLKAGFARNDSEFIDVFIDNFNVMARRMR